jgi:hypothetical protein
MRAEIGSRMDAQHAARSEAAANPAPNSTPTTTRDQVVTAASLSRSTAPPGLSCFRPHRRSASLAAMSDSRIPDRPDRFCWRASASPCVPKVSQGRRRAALAAGGAPGGRRDLRAVHRPDLRTRDLEAAVAGQAPTV